MTLEELAAKYSVLDQKVDVMEKDISKLKEKPPAVPGVWETVYPWVTSKTAIALYSAIAAALMTWLSGAVPVAMTKQQVPAMREAAP